LLTFKNPRIFVTENNRNNNMEKTKKPLTRAELDVMNVLWDSPLALTINDIVERYSNPKPAYTTVATFLKILDAKGYVEHKRKEETGRTFFYSPMMSREKYITHVLNDVKDTLFGSSTKRLCSFLIQNDELSEEDLREILALIKS
jgi:predicted transcriptional regulator